jgi:RNA polymerase sigma-32 factor
MTKQHIDEGGLMHAKKNYGHSHEPLPAVRDTMQVYLAQIRKFPMPSPRQNTALAIQYWKTGNKKYASSLATANLRLVVKIALKYYGKWMLDPMDIIQEGNVGLIQAIKKYDPFRGVKFSFYAAYWVKAYILRFIIDNVRLVKVGTGKTQRMLFYNLRKEKTRLETMGFNPGPELLALVLETDSRKIIEMEQRLDNNEISLDAMQAEGLNTSRYQFISSGAAAFDTALADQQLFNFAFQKLETFKISLDARRQDIFAERVISDNPPTLETIGKRYGITKERVRQIEEGLKSAARKLLQETYPDIQQPAADKGYEGGSPHRTH